MIPIYKRMSDAHLIKRMEKGKTQNSNECLHQTGSHVEDLLKFCDPQGVPKCAQIAYM